MNDPAFILADEPTGALDSQTSIKIMNVFKKLNEEEGTTIVLVTHGPATVYYCNRVVHTQKGILTEEIR